MNPQEKLEALERMGKMPRDIDWHPLRTQFLESLNQKATEK